MYGVYSMCWMYIITICSTCDVHTYIHIVKDARLAGIFYWSQTGHIFGQRPSYTNRETERTRVKDQDQEQEQEQEQDQDQSRLQVHTSVVKITSERPIEKITSPTHIWHKCLFKWEMVYKDISTCPHQSGHKHKSQSQKMGNAVVYIQALKCLERSSLSKNVWYTCTLCQGNRVANNIKYEQKYDV